MLYTSLLGKRKRLKILELTRTRTFCFYRLQTHLIICLICWVVGRAFRGPFWRHVLKSSVLFAPGLLGTKGVSSAWQHCEKLMGHLRGV